LHLLKNESSDDFQFVDGGEQDIEVPEDKFDDIPKNLDKSIKNESVEEKDD